MNYLSGEEVLLGDRIEIGGDSGNIVVCVFESGVFSESFPKEEWDYLKNGFLVKSQKMGTVYYPEIPPGLNLVSRGSD
jgi:hypothetical protein